MTKLESINPANVLAFKDIRLRALWDSPTAFSSTYAEESKLTDADWLNRAAQWSGANSVGYLAMNGSGAVGIAAGILDQNEPLRAELVSMWIAPPHRRLGIGRMLVDAVLTWARGRNVLNLCLMVTSNNDHARQFYQSVGFTLTGHMTPYRNDPALLDYEMSRSIS
jgi:ribosomal protein S18 acetylase RimI-like enzyme